MHARPPSPGPCGCKSCRRTHSLRVSLRPQFIYERAQFHPAISPNCCKLEESQAGKVFRAPRNIRSRSKSSLAALECRCKSADFWPCSFQGPTVSRTDSLSATYDPKANYSGTKLRLGKCWKRHQSVGTGLFPQFVLRPKGSLTKHFLSKEILWTFSLITFYCSKNIQTIFKPLLTSLKRYLMWKKPKN